METPPRVRGEGGAEPASGLPLGNTPARAGRGDSPPICGHGGWKHPRACGERSIGLLSMTAATETPPRVRGEEEQAQHLRQRRRNTPARAGRGLADVGVVRVVKKHPRACGERSGTAVPSAHGTETPPRVRGEDDTEGRHEVRRGNTPARAGRGPAPRSRRRTAPKHPRACGERTATTATRRCRDETPPRVRGEGSVGAAAAHVLGNTPARAGRGRSPRRRPGTSRKHPRACGERRRRR